MMPGCTSHDNDLPRHNPGSQGAHSIVAVADSDRPAGANCFCCSVNMLQFLLHPIVDRTLRINTVAISCAGGNSGQHFDPFIDACSRRRYETCRRFHRRDDVAAQHQIAQVGARNHHALAPRQTFQPADIVVAFDFLIDAADRLNLAVLIDRTGHGDALLGSGFPTSSTGVHRARSTTRCRRRRHRRTVRNRPAR